MGSVFEIHWPNNFNYKPTTSIQKLFEAKLFSVLLSWPHGDESYFHVCLLQPILFYKYET